MTTRYAAQEREFTRDEMRDIARKIKAKFPDRVERVENGDMDPGRFFVHLRQPWTFNEGYGIQRSKSFGGLREAYRVLARLETEE